MIGATVQNQDEWRPLRGMVIATPPDESVPEGHVWVRWENGLTCAEALTDIFISRAEAMTDTFITLAEALRLQGAGPRDESTATKAEQDRARIEYGTAYINIDINAKASRADEGYWVQAWVYISTSDDEAPA